MSIMAGTPKDDRFTSDGLPKSLDNPPASKERERFSSPSFWQEVSVDEPIPVELTESPERAPFEHCVRNVFAFAEDVLISKHHDYGPKNISLSPGGPLNGLRVRMWDKLARINNLIETGVAPTNESLGDSFLDLMNYSAIALLVLDGDWPE